LGGMGSQRVEKGSAVWNWAGRFAFEFSKVIWAPGPRSGPFAFVPCESLYACADSPPPPWNPVDGRVA
jgi:hypothetical protein